MGEEPDDASRLEEYETLLAARLDGVRVNQPLVLISQIQRSGGTLLSQLFDGHPQCHAHPHELTIGSPKKELWPSLDVDDGPEEWYRILEETRLPKLFRDGYAKYGRGPQAAERDRFPFLLPPRLLRELFLQRASLLTAARPRDILDCYMTSFFNAWLDNQNLYAGPKRIVTAFTPRLVMVPESVAGFFRDYPDGWLISVLRDPTSWFASASRHNPAEYGDAGRAIELWTASADRIVSAKAEFGDRVIVLEYERLVRDTERELRRLSALLGIDFVPSLLTPTFNGRPIMANSSFEVAGHGVLEAPLHRGAELDADVARLIEESTAGAYARAAALTR